MNITRATLLVAFTVLLGFTSAAHAVVIGGMTLTDLGANVTPNAINNLGQVVGQNALGQAFVWQAGTTTTLAMPSGTQAVANDINDYGQVVGYFVNSNSKMHAFRWTGGTATDLNPNGVNQYVAEAVSNSGLVAGWITNSTGTVTRSAEWSSTNVFSTLFGTSSNHKALGINDVGQVVGVQLGSNGQPNLGYYWGGSDASSWTTGFPSYFPIVAITNNGWTGGQEGTQSANWRLGDSVDTGIGKLSPSDSGSQINGLNDNGLFAGYSGSKALLYDVSVDTLYNMNDYLPAGSSFTSLTALNDINNGNQFIGVGLVDGVPHGFFGQIVPEPSTFVLMGAGLIVFLVARARRRGNRY